jgi:hypothetical protein
MRALITTLLLLSVVLAGDSAPDRRRAILKAKAAEAGGGGPDVYYDSTLSSDGNEGIGAVNMEWMPVVVSVGGTLTKLRVKIHDCGVASNVKLACYDNGGTLLGSCTIAIPDTASNEYFEGNVTPVAITASTVYVAIIADSGFPRLRSLSSGTYSYSASTYAGFPPGTLPADSGPLSESLLLGLYVD